MIPSTRLRDSSTECSVAVSLFIRPATFTLIVRYRTQ